MCLVRSKSFSKQISQNLPTVLEEIVISPNSSPVLLTLADLVFIVTLYYYYVPTATAVNNTIC